MQTRKEKMRVGRVPLERLGKKEWMKLMMIGIMMQGQQLVGDVRG